MSINFGSIFSTITLQQKLLIKPIVLLVFLFSCVNNFGQNLSASISTQHGAGCDDQSGILTVSASGGSGIYTFLWNTGDTTTTVNNLGAGVYTVQITDGSESINVSFTLEPFGVQNLNILNSCSGNPGNAQITAYNAQSPVSIHWFNSSGVQISTTPSVFNLSAGQYSYTLTDADGCVDSSTFFIQASSPVLEMFAEDSILCYNESTSIWFTPGFTLYDGMFPVYNTDTDTLTYINSNSGNYLPTDGMDQYGCWATVSNNPIVYTQAEPWPMLTIYNYGDTISLDWGINENPDPLNYYNWYLNSVQIASYSYSYLPTQGPGTYSVQKVNQYGCYNTGVIEVTFSGINENTSGSIQVLENPVTAESNWIINFQGEDKTAGILYNSLGQYIQTYLLNNGMNAFGKELSSGMYFLLLEQQSVHLMKN